jgi:lysophospholipase L1-like esterase
VERRTLLRRASELGIDTLDLLPDLLREKQQDRELRLTFPNDFHWNPQGHELAAAELSRAIQAATPLAKRR